MIDSYRKGNLSIPFEKFSLLMGLMKEEEDKDYFKNKVGEKESNWGQIIGGKNAYKINKDKFDEGRKKGSKASKDNVKYDFDVNIPLSKGLCEFIGAIIGDGFTNKYKNFYQTQITGDKKLDLGYYQKVLKTICEELFKITPKITEKDNVIRLNIYSKRLFEMLTKRFEIPAGKKCYSVKIPEEILKSKEEFINATLRGMFDTDGGIGLDKRKTYKKPYIRINYTSTSHNLIEQIHHILESYFIAHSVHKKMILSLNKFRLTVRKMFNYFSEK